MERVRGVLSAAIKWWVHEDVHSPPTCAKAKKMWIYTSTAPYVFMACCLTNKHRDKYSDKIKVTFLVVISVRV
jgi:hypothetical protein